MRRRAGVVLTMLCATVAACATRTGPPLPEIGETVDRVRTRTEESMTTRQKVERNLQRMRDTLVGLSTVSTDLFETPFPRGLFKQVALTCLNASNTRASEDREGVRLALLDGDARLDCRPTYLQRLLERLGDASTEQRREALHLLLDLDRFRQLRHNLYRHLDALPDTIRQARAYTAEQRADIRRTRSRFDERRPEYTRTRWRQVEGRLRVLRRRLDALEKTSKELEQLVERWRLQIRSLDKAVYFLITSRWASPERNGFD